MGIRVRQFALYALLGGLALGVGAWVAQQRYTPKAHGDRVPASMWTMPFTGMHAQRVTLAPWRGQTLVLNFWATWCAPCREEIPDLLAIRQQYADKSVEIVGIAIDNAQSVAPYANKMKIAYPIVLGEGEALNLARVLGNPSGALPYTVVVAPDGAIVMRHLGRLPKAKLQAILDRSATR